jgi:sugar phosphate isomerase/epimerase
MITRRELLATSLLPLAFAQQKPFRNFGGAPAGFPIRTRAARDARRPFDFLDYCHSLGFAVAETRVDTSNPEAVRDFRRRLDSYNMRAILSVNLPRTESDLPAFDAALAAVREAGVRLLHAAMTQRRYEQFDSAAAFKQDFERCRRTIALAEPLLRKHQVRLGIENHKGWRSAEQAAWMKTLSSEWVGVHFDFGNNLSLCEDPAETLRALLPYVVACHIKDMAVEPYEDGFLLSEVPLGDGMLDLKSMVAALRAKDATMPLDLEMITRDPLKIPVFTEKYWATFDSDSPLPGRDLAHTLELVRRNKPKSPLPRLTGMPLEAQLKLEDDFIQKSISWARQNLEI